jgi:hypothetical protein
MLYHILKIYSKGRCLRCTARCFDICIHCEMITIIKLINMFINISTWLLVYVRYEISTHYESRSHDKCSYHKANNKGNGKKLWELMNFFMALMAMVSGITIYPHMYEIAYIKYVQLFIC